MKRIQHILAAVFAAFVALSLLLVVLFETDTLPVGTLKGVCADGEFVAAAVMELLTLCVIPVALRLFRFDAVRRSMASGGAQLRWSLVRILMLCVPMAANTLLYYLYMNVAFGYMGIILLLCLAFVLPTRARCEAEAAGPCTTDSKQSDKTQDK